MEADHFTVQLKEGFIQKSKKVLKVDAILSVYRMRFVTSLNLCVVKRTYRITLHAQETI